MPMEVARIASALGARVEGVDLRSIAPDFEREILSLLNQF